MLLYTSKTFHLCLDMGKDDGDDYNDGESSYEDCYEQNDDEQHAILRWRKTNSRLTNNRMKKNMLLNEF